MAKLFKNLTSFRVILHTLPDRLPFDLSVHFASQLPIFLTGVYFNG